MKAIRHPAGADDGVTLVELVVSMTIMAVMLTIFTTGVLQMYRAANKTESLATAQSQLNTVFLRMDKVVRYASGITVVAERDGGHYVGLLTVASAPSPSTSAQATERCYALRLKGISLWIIDWDDRVPQGPSAPPWTSLATDVQAPAGAKPFTVKAADALNPFIRLQLNLMAVVGSGVKGTNTDTRITFTALNTSLTTPPAPVCTRYAAP
jgi:prepilin-type N-terminal cleavage/methylation domain-containing protein